MAHAYYHARSSARKFGGTWEDYIALHEWFDSTKAHIGDNRHRLLLHNSWGIFLCEQIFGVVLTRKSDGKEVPTRTIAEQHVLEDLRFIPSLEQCFADVPIKPWLYTRAEQLSQQGEEQQKEEEEEEGGDHFTMTTPMFTAAQLQKYAEELEVYTNWSIVYEFCETVYGPGRAAKVEVETYGEYNDEGGTDYRVTSVTAYDANGEKLDFDLSLFYWHTGEDSADLHKIEDKEEQQEAALEYLKDDWKGPWDTLPCDRHSGGDETYDLTTPPTLSFSLATE